MRARRGIRLFWLAALLAAPAVLAGCPSRDDSRAGERGAPARFGDLRVAEAPDVTMPDEALLDQDGHSVRLRELAAGRVLVVNFVFTTCTTICSPMAAVFSRVQDELGDSLDAEVRLVSISLDPATDTPERLRRWADKFERRPGWTFLTGELSKVKSVLRALGGDAPIKEEHTPVTLVGRADEGRWVRLSGIPSSARLAQEIREMSSTRASSRSAAPK